MTQITVDIKKERRNLGIAYVAAAAAVNIVLLFVMGSSISSHVGDITRVATISAATALSVVVVAKQGIRGMFGKSYLALCVALSLWAVAESIWAYTEIVLGQRAPFPSIADGFWLAAYGAFAYYLYKLFKFFGRGVKKYKIVIVTLGAIAYVAYNAYSIITTSTISNYSDLGGVAISIAYPAMDGALFIPAVLTVLNAGRGQLTSVPWIFIAWILVGLADTMLGFDEVTGFQGDTSPISLVYNAGYLCFAAGLVWYIQFFISGNKVTFKPQTLKVVYTLPATPSRNLSQVFNCLTIEVK